MKKICKTCKNWTMTMPEVKIGVCSVFKNKTEWCAGEVLRSPKKLIICEGYNPL